MSERSEMRRLMELFESTDVENTTAEQVVEPNTESPVKLAENCEDDQSEFVGTMRSCLDAIFRAQGKSETFNFYYREYENLLNAFAEAYEQDDDDDDDDDGDDDGDEDDDGGLDLESVLDEMRDTIRGIEATLVDLGLEPSPTDDYDDLDTTAWEDQ